MSPRSPLPSKPCVACGRSIVWRKKWERCFDEIRYCSDACKRGISRQDLALEQAILSLLAGRPKEASICPSEAARIVGGEDWRPLMEPARRAARRLVARGAVQITQGGRVVDPSSVRGPIRIRTTR